MTRPSVNRLRAVAVLAAAVLTGCAIEEPLDWDASTSTSPKPSASTTPTTSTAPSRPTTPAGKEAGKVTIVVTGDVLLHERLWNTARIDGHGRRDFAPMLAPVEPLVAGADLAVCHLETPLAPAGGPFRGFPLFAGPPEIAPALRRTGYDACTTASNHSVDGGAAGVDRTLDTLDAAGLRHTGTARTATEAATPTILDVHGVKVALLSYAYGFNGLARPAGQDWRANRIDEDRIHAAAARARTAGADIVVLVCHWGDEYVQRPSAQQRELAPRLLADDSIDLVIGHHAHVVQPIERIDGKWVAYGLGNLVAAHREPNSPKAEGLLVRFTFTRGTNGRWSATKGEYAPLLVTDTLPVRVLDVTRALATHPTARLRLAQRRTEAVARTPGSAVLPVER